jgi:hypothetical protein
MSLTVSEAKAKSSLERVKALTDDQIQASLDVCEQILLAFGLDTSVTDYTTIFNRCHLMAFEWYVNNPAGYKSVTQGASSEVFSGSLPGVILLALAPIRSGATGVLYRDGGF